MTAQLFKLLLLKLLTSCLCLVHLALDLSHQLIHLLSHSCPNTHHLLLLSIAHTQHSAHTHATVLKLQPQAKWNFAQRFCAMHNLKTLDEILYHYLSVIQIPNTTNLNSSSPSMHLISSQLNLIMV
jgi:hypothetical protein